MTPSPMRLHRRTSFPAAQTAPRRARTRSSCPPAWFPPQSLAWRATPASSPRSCSGRRGRESWRPYTLLSYTGDDLLYIRLPGPPVHGTPGSADHRARWAADLSARHRAHGGQLNNHSCWMRNLLPGLEARGSHREPGRVGQPGRDVEVVRDPLELGVQHPHQARGGRRLAARDLLDRVGGAHRAAPRSWPGGPSESSMSMPPTQMSLTRGRGH
jgi:hypothetical protein